MNEMTAIPAPPDRLQAGIHIGVPEHVYHADPCQFPSLSSGIGRLLIQRSPLHAWHAHPRLNVGAVERVASAAMNDGTLLHKLILGVGAPVVIVDAADWRTKAAKEERDAAIEAGHTPILADRYYELEQCAEAARMRIGDHLEASNALTKGIGSPEATVIWRDGHALCRVRVDWLPHNPALPLIDLKTTGKSANPEDWERSLIRNYAFQAAFYARGVGLVRKCPPPAMWFIVIETAPPYGMSVLTPAPSLMALAQQHVETAIQRWTKCQRSNAWPGYPPYVAHVEAPGWMLAKADEQAMRDEFMHEMEEAI